MNGRTLTLDGNEAAAQVCASPYRGHEEYCVYDVTIDDAKEPLEIKWYNE